MPNPRKEEKIATVQIASGSDCVLARQRAKQIAALLGFENQDQTRIATAVSEIARNAFEYAGGGSVRFSLQHGAVNEMWVRISDRGRGIPHLEEIWSGTYHSHAGLGLGLIGAKRLVDHFELETSPSGTVVRLGKSMTRSKPIPEVREIIERLDKLGASDPRLQLRHENQELLELLETLRSREAELERVNNELEETNRGVLALYKELEDKAAFLREASEAKSRFLSTVSHELRTPLHSIASLSRLLLDRMDGDLTPEQEKQIQFMLRSAHGLSEMVTDLLDIAKIEAGRIDVKSSEFAVGEIFSALRGMFRPLLTGDLVKLIFREDLSNLRLRTDEGKLAQILRNLIANALKFTQAGSVTVSATVGEGDQVIFAVMDTGVGIATEHRDTVFEEWGQVPSAQRSTHKGSGLGLPLSRRLAQLLGGSLYFESVVGQGTTFFLPIPMGISAVVPDLTPNSSRDPVILIADDDEVARYVLMKQLRSLTAARFVEAKGGKEALEVSTKELPQLIFLDLTMPDKSGEEVLKELRGEELTSGLPVVIVTARDLEPEREQLLRTQTMDIISKQQGSGEEQRVQLERALLVVGLYNQHT